MTDSSPVRGPDFLPYPLPDREVAPATPLLPPPPGPSRWRTALDGLTPWGVAALTAGAVALVCLLLVSLVAGEREAGAWLTTSAGLVAVITGVRGLKDEQPEDSKVLVRGGIASGVVAAVIALLLLLTHRDAVGEQPPVQVPSPVPTTSSQPLPTPSSSDTPTPQPSLGTIPPGSENRFGIPTDPGPPVTVPSTDKGLLLGRVVTTSGAPLAGATVTVTRADPADVSDSASCPLKVTATSDAKGGYRLELCQLGDQLGYHVAITSGTASAMTDLFVNSGQTTVYNVILPVRHA